MKQSVDCIYSLAKHPPLRASPRGGFVSAKRSLCFNGYFSERIRRLALAVQVRLFFIGQDFYSSTFYIEMYDAGRFQDCQHFGKANIS